MKLTNNYKKEIKMKNTFKEDLEKRLSNPKVKHEFDLLDTEYKIIQSVIDIRKGLDLTQKELSNLTGIDQADISKIERGIANPTLKLLQKLANGMGMTIELKFVPKPK